MRVSWRVNSGSWARSFYGMDPRGAAGRARLRSRASGGAKPSILQRLREVAPARGFPHPSPAVRGLHALYARLFLRLTCFAVTCLTRMLFRRYEIVGLENLDAVRKGPVIFVANHTSHLDPFATGAAITQHCRRLWFIAASEYWEKFFFRFLYIIGGAIPFDRKVQDEEAFFNQLRPYVERLHAGDAVFLFPEGTVAGDLRVGHDPRQCRLRSDWQRETALLKAGPLAIMLAWVTGARIVPLSINGLGAAIPPEVYPCKVLPWQRFKKFPFKLCFGKPIDVCKELSGEVKDREPTRTDMLRFANRRVMPAIAELVDLRMGLIPLTGLPLSDADLRNLRTHEERVATLARDRHGNKDYYDRVFSGGSERRG